MGVKYVYINNWIAWNTTTKFLVISINCESWLRNVLTLVCHYSYLPFPLQNIIADVRRYVPFLSFADWRSESCSAAGCTWVGLLWKKSEGGLLSHQQGAVCSETSTSVLTQTSTGTWGRPPGEQTQKSSHNQLLGICKKTKVPSYFLINFITKMKMWNMVSCTATPATKQEKGRSLGMCEGLLSESCEDCGSGNSSASGWANGRRATKVWSLQWPNTLSILKSRSFIVQMWVKHIPLQNCSLTGCMLKRMEWWRRVFISGGGTWWRSWRVSRWRPGRHFPCGSSSLTCLIDAPFTCANCGIGGRSCGDVHLSRTPTPFRWVQAVIFKFLCSASALPFLI